MSWHDVGVVMTVGTWAWLLLVIGISVFIYPKKKDD